MERGTLIAEKVKLTEELIAAQREFDALHEKFVCAPSLFVGSPRMSFSLLLS